MQRWAWLVRGWVTAWQRHVLVTFAGTATCCRFVENWASISETRWLLNAEVNGGALKIGKRAKCKGRFGARPYVKNQKCERWIGRMWKQAFMAYFKKLILEFTACNSRMLYVISTTDVMFYVSARFKFGVWIFCRWHRHAETCRSAERSYFSTCL